MCVAVHMHRMLVDGVQFACWAVVHAEVCDTLACSSPALRKAASVLWTGSVFGWVTSAGRTGQPVDGMLCCGGW